MPSHERASHHRDSALRRLRRTTTVALAVAGALVAAFAGLAARALPGRHSGSGGTGSTTTTTAVPARATRARATPPPLVPAGSSEAPSASSAPASPPVQTQAPPVVVSGGT